MKTILKIGEPVYSQSLRHLVPSKLEGFPQREQFLLQHVKDVELSIFKHQELKDLEDVSRERRRLTDFLKGKSYSYLMVDNPLSAMVIDREIDIPILFDCIDWYDEIYLREFGVDKRYHLIRYGLLDLLERATKVVAQSPVILDALVSWGLKTDNTMVIPNGFDSRIFFPFASDKISAARDELSQRFRVNLSGKDVIVYTGRLSPWYEAVKTIAQAIQDSQVFFIVGDGPLLKQIPDAANVVKCGAVAASDVPHYTNAADLLVFSADSDCSPIVVSEYLAVGKPIVMPKGRIEWLLEEGRTGCLVDNNPYSWRLGISRALVDRDNLGRNNLSLAKDLSWQTLAHKFSTFVQE